MRTRRTVTLGILAVSALVVAGCSSDSGDGTPSAAPSSVVTVTETVTESATPSPTASATTTKPASGPECATGDLKAIVNAGQAGAGQRQATLVLTNTSDTICTITGYPGLQLVTSGGAKVPTKVVRVSAPKPKTLKVKPDGSASATLTFGVVPTGSEPNTGACEKEASTLQVIPPDATKSISTPWTLGPVCNKGKISVNAFVAGSGS